MATNENSPKGFVHCGDLNGGSPSVKEFTHASADACGIGRGDMCDITGVKGIIKQGSAAAPLYGVSAGYVAISTLGKTSVILAAPTSIYEVQEDGNVGTTGEGLIANSVTAIAPSTITLLSKCQLSSTTASTTATQQWRLYAVSPRVGNDGSSTNAKWLVIPNAVRYSSAATPLVGID